MRLTINVNGQDVFVSDVLHLLNMLSFHGKADLCPVPGTLVVIHAETDRSRITEQFTIPEDEDADI